MTTRIAPEQPIAARPVRVTWSYLSILLSICLSLNIVLTPLKAYLCEPYPWQLPPLPPILKASDASWTTVEATLLEAAKRQYNSSIFTGTTYIFDAETWTSIYRDVFPMPLPPVSCQVDLMTQLNGGAFLPHALQEKLCVAISNTSYSVSACFEAQLFASTFNVGCVWTMPGNDSVIVYGAYRMTSSVTALTLKLAVRISLTLYMAGVMWRRYYRQYRSLALQCQRYPKVGRVHICVGDPTSIFLLHPVLCLCLVLDVWQSVGTVYLEMLAVLQVDDFWQFALGYLYLSRSVWFGYAFLSCTSMLLKKCKREHWFTPLDPTLVAIAAALATGPVTMINGRTAFLVFYSWLFNVLATSYHSIEITAGVFFYTIGLGLLPLLAGFGLRWMHCWRVTQPADYAAISFNDIKQRVLLTLERLSLGVPANVRRRGGSIHAVCAHLSRLKASPCISQRGADCYLILYDQLGAPIEVVRLSLKTCIDMTDEDLDVLVLPTSNVFGHVGLVSDESTGVNQLLQHPPLGSDCAWIE
ncbi:hypothetical protein SDRG_17242 [Saprolegnia diclina VS20]|uniref:Transmembrane protein n=1 Tax=Saprolegnia diclina (strain VS20) TaxID=1156394 RepID=T0PHM4_SAPDV|nr:hypothetical protein SDRG_17242 [Saprolegnia diclina VS20]EQC24864.1 hypothetical protein SDRG_17242 [Saprolegnia diclina VS20]|eukprot:XP_008621704.1 hypothetical protein SDRG_17242 [Saprolegnia diclina VS20]